MSLLTRVDGKVVKPMPSPTEEDLKSPLFEAIWHTIKMWDVSVPEYYQGYCGATGSHVKLILMAIDRTKETLKYTKRAQIPQGTVPILRS